MFGINGNLYQLFRKHNNPYVLILHWLIIRTIVEEAPRTLPSIVTLGDRDWNTHTVPLFRLSEYVYRDIVKGNFKRINTMRPDEKLWRKYWRYQNEKDLGHTPKASVGPLIPPVWVVSVSSRSFWDMANKWCSTLGSLGHSNHKMFRCLRQETAADPDRYGHNIKIKVS